MKKTLAILLAAVMVLTLFAGCGNKDDQANVIKIGVFEPASGDNGAGGKQETLGIQYAHSVAPTVEIGGVTYDIQLEIVDNESSNDKAATAANTLINAGCSIVLGSYGSGVSIAASDIFGNAQIPVIGITCTNPQVTEGNEHYFRICFLDPFQGTVLANFAKEELGVTKAYCLAKMGDDYSTGLVNYFKEAFEGLGGTVVSQTFPDGTSDFTSYITTAQNEGCGVFFSPVSTEAAANIVEHANAQGMTMPILAGDTWDSNVVLQAAEGTANNIYITTFFDEGDTAQAAVDFVSGCKTYINGNAEAKTNNNGDDTIAAVTAMGYDAYFVALEALKAAADPTDPVAINEVLWDVNYDGVTGNIQFDEIGDAIRNVAYIKKVNTTDAVWEFVAVQSVQ